MRILGGGRAIMLALLIAACGANGADDPADAPTEAPPSPAATTATAAPEALPTWTPESALDSAAADEPSEAEPLLPPTWTPRAPTVPTATPTLNIPTQTPRPTHTPLPDWCNALVAIEAPGASIAGHPVHLRWGALENAAQYRVELRNGSGNLVHSTVIEDTEYTFSGDLFTLPSVYGWEVAPLDEDGTPICFAISNEIVVSIPPE